MKFLILLFCAFIGFCAPNESKIPVIGILSKPIDGGYHINTTKKQLIDGPYVHFLEAGGAKVAYINYNDTEENLRKIFNKINGILLPGGSTAFLDHNRELTKFARTGKFLINLAIESYKNGDYFPIWGTCLGFELMCVSIAENPYIRKGGCDCEYYHAELEFTHESYSSNLFNKISAENLYKLSTIPMTYNNHVYYLSPVDFQANNKLSEIFNIVALSYDIPKKMRFISIIEGKKYPFYGVQFHPEKNAYLFDPRNPILHSGESIEIMQEMSEFFVEECRKNMHKFENLEEMANSLVYQGEALNDQFRGLTYLFP